MSSHDFPTFSERIRKRQAVWWGGPSYRIGTRLHRALERLLPHGFDGPAQRWKCCEFWQRALSNKLHGHAFALAFGCRVPDLYWTGRLVRSLPFDTLPDAFVVKPTVGARSRGVFACAGGVDKMTGEPVDEGSLIKSIRKAYGPLPVFPLMVEEFLRPESGECRLPFDFKFHVFRNRIALVRVTDRTRGRNNALDGFFTPDWTPIEQPFIEPMAPLGKIPPPRCFDEMLESARRLGEAYGTYVRVDMYATPKGCVFGEFSSAPRRGNGYTAFADDLLGRYWQETCPDDP